MNLKANGGQFTWEGLKREKRKNNVIINTKSKTMI